MFRPCKTLESYFRKRSENDFPSKDPKMSTLKRIIKQFTKQGSNYSLINEDLQRGKKVN